MPLYDGISVKFKFKQAEESCPVLIWYIYWEWLSCIRNTPYTTAVGCGVTTAGGSGSRLGSEYDADILSAFYLRSGFAQSWIWYPSVCSGTEFNSCGGRRRRRETDPSGVNPQPCVGTQMLNKHNDGLFYKLKVTPTTSSLNTVHSLVPCNYTPTRIRVFLNTYPADITSVKKS
jgi:hypothetical protein